MTSVLDPELVREIEQTRWYHTLELPGGIVTPGEFDTRSAAGVVPMPASLEGKRCLDVGTRDGFWAFEMERRGASEVIGIDVGDTSQHDWPTPRPPLDAGQKDALDRSQDAFEVAKRALDATAERRFISVYDLDPDEVGTFDYAFLGTLLLHLRDPVGALTAVRRVLKPGATLLLNEPVSLTLDVLRPRTPAAVMVSLDAPFWWIPNRAGLRQYVTKAGYRCVDMSRVYRVDNGSSMKLPRLSLRPNALGSFRHQLAMRAGQPHVHLIAQPVPDRT